jgi:hypothetical protein
MLAAGLAEVDLAAGVRTTGAFNGGRAVFVAGYIAEGGVAVVRGRGHSVLLGLALSRWKKILVN